MRFENDMVEIKILISVSKFGKELCPMAVTYRNSKIPEFQHLFFTLCIFLIGLDSI